MTAACGCGRDGTGRYERGGIDQEPARWEAVCRSVGPHLMPSKRFRGYLRGQFR